MVIRGTIGIRHHDERLEDGAAYCVTCGAERPTIHSRETHVLLALMFIPLFVLRDKLVAQCHGCGAREERNVPPALGAPSWMERFGFAVLLGIAWIGLGGVVAVDAVSTRLAARRHAEWERHEDATFVERARARDAALTAEIERGLARCDASGELTREEQRIARSPAVRIVDVRVPDTKPVRLYCVRLTETPGTSATGDLASRLHFALYDRPPATSDLPTYVVALGQGDSLDVFRDDKTSQSGGVQLRSLPGPTTPPKTRRELVPWLAAHHPTEAFREAEAEHTRRANRGNP